MVRIRKKRKEEEVNQGGDKRITRGRARAEAASLALVPMESLSQSSNLMSQSNCASPFRWRKSAKRSVPPANISVKKLGKSMDETIAETEDLNNHKQADQPLSSPASGDVPAGLSNTFALMLPPAPIVPCSAQTLEINVAAVDTFDSNITPSKKARIEEVKAENNITEDCPGDNIVSFQQGNETNLGLTVSMDMFPDNGSPEDVASSDLSSALVSAGGYKVKKVAASMLKKCLSPARAGSVPKEVDVDADDNIILNKLLQGEMGGKPTSAKECPKDMSANSSSDSENLGQSCRAPIVSEPANEVEVAAANVSNIISSKLPQGEVRAKPIVVEKVAAANASSIVSSRLPQGEMGATPTVVEEVAADNVSSIISSKLPQGEVGATPTVVEEVAADNVTNFASSKLPREEVGANALPDDENHGQSCKLGLTEVINMGNDDSGEDEVESSASLVSVGIYKVKKESAGILKDILEKHGDIAAGMPGPVESRAYFLVQVCDFVQMMYQKEFADVSQADIESFSAIVTGLEGSKLELGWLRKGIQEIQEAKRVINDYSRLKVMKAQQSQTIRESHQEIEEYQRKLRETEQKLEAAREKSKMIKEKVNSAWATMNLFSK